jgi:hypothetical protein
MRLVGIFTLALAVGCGGDFGGTWEGTVDGTASTVELKQEGTSLSGKVAVGNYAYQMSGTVDGESAKGILTDPSGAAMEYTAKRSGDDLTISVSNPFGGNRDFSFKRKAGGEKSGGGVPSGSLWGGAAGGGGASPSGSPGSSSAERDTALVGSWSRTEGMSSGGASFAAQQLLRINADGTFEQGAGRAAGGGAGWSASSGNGTEVVGRGKWSTKGNIVHVDGAPYARYYVEGSKLMFTFGDGSRQIWYRSN